MKFSVVIPIYNEEETLPQLYERVTAAAAEWPGEYEIICVDDGSTDRTGELLDQLHERDHRWKKVAFSRNFGHQAAVSAGLTYARGAAVGIIDGDLQDPPEMLGTMFKQWERGSKVVYAIRATRQEHWLKRLAYKTFYRLLQQCASIKIPLDSGDFCVMDRRVVDIINDLPERCRFLRGLRTWSGFRQTGIPYDRDARHQGASKYTIKKLFRLAIDGLLGFSSLPLRISSFMGMLFCLTSTLLVGLLLLWRLSNISLWGMHPAQSMGWTSLVSIVMFLAGIQMLMLGIVGEYVARIFEEVKGRPGWVVAETTGIPSPPASDPPSPKSLDRFLAHRTSERAA